MEWMLPSFNNNTTSWEVSNVTSMDWMFRLASLFNINISYWGISSVSCMVKMFDSWNVSSVTSMFGMFESVSSFNKNILCSDVSSDQTKVVWRSARNFLPTARVLL